MERTALDDRTMTQILQLLPMPAWICDSSGRITATNERWDRYVGDTSSLRRQWLSDRLVHTDDVGGLAARWRQARQSRTATRAIVRLRRFDGTWTWHELMLAPLGDPGAADGRGTDWLGCWIDVTQLQQEGSHVLEQRQLERLRSDIVATVGHELRTPLTSIYGMAITLRRDDLNLTDAARGDLLDVIVDQSLRMSKTIDDFLAASGLEQGQLTVQAHPCDVAAVASAVVEAMDSQVPSEVHVQLRRSRAPTVAQADEHRLHQILANLVENAIKYSPGGGDVQVRVRRAGANVCVDVADHGLGIAHSEQSHVFDRFHRLDPGQTMGVAGTGLGLYIAREMARRMGGDVTVRSRPGRGSTFTLRLPAA
jgi:PAS domain S-box-containing protein